MRSSQARTVASLCAALLLSSMMLTPCEAQQPVTPPYPVAYGAVYSAPRPANYNPVGFGFGGYSYGGYPAYGFNGYLPSVYAGFNTPGVAGPAPGGYSYYTASEAYGATCGPTGCRLNYRGWSPEAAVARPATQQPPVSYGFGQPGPR